MAQMQNLTSLKPHHMWWLVFIKLQGLHNRYLLIGSVGWKEWTEKGQRESSYSHNFNSKFKFAIWDVGGVWDIKCIWKKLQNMFSKYKCSGVNAKVGGPSLKLNEENCCNVNRRTRRRNATRRMKNSICTSRNAFLYKDSHLCVHMCVCSILPFFLHYISLFC